MIIDLSTLDTLDIAKQLIGHVLVYDGLSVFINEPEAYTEDDPASHSYGGRRTNRNRPMFLEAGTIYIYKIYGIHRCLNIVTGPKNIGEAILIRSIVPVMGINEMIKNRNKLTNITNGPSKLCQALDIQIDLNGSLLGESISIQSGVDVSKHIIKTPRIGISQGKEKLWRFFCDAKHFQA